jgi:hypothetical protein
VREGIRGDNSCPLLPVMTDVEWYPCVLGW